MDNKNLYNSIKDLPDDVDESTTFFVWAVRPNGDRVIVMQGNGDDVSQMMGDAADLFVEKDMADLEHMEVGGTA